MLLMRIPFYRKNFRPFSHSRKTILKNEYTGGRILGMISDAYFIDIGIPEDYQRAQTELIATIKDIR